jgi:hypothetical protein
VTEIFWFELLLRIFIFTRNLSFLDVIRPLVESVTENSIETHQTISVTQPFQSDFGAIQLRERKQHTS